MRPYRVINAVTPPGAWHLASDAPWEVASQLPHDNTRDTALMPHDAHRAPADCRYSMRRIYPEVALGPSPTRVLGKAIGGTLIVASQLARRNTYNLASQPL